MSSAADLAHPMAIIVATGILLCVFLRGVMHKIIDFSWFAHALAEYRILPRTVATSAAIVLTAAETVVAFGLVVPQTRMIAAIGAALLLAIYAASIAVNLLRGRTGIDCGCGGAGQGLSWFLVLRNAVLVGFALVAAQSPIPADVGPSGWITALAAIASFWLLIVVTEKLAENLSYLAAADAVHEHRHGAGTH